MTDVGQVVYSAEYCKNVLQWLSSHPARVHSFKKAVRRHCRSRALTPRQVDTALQAWGLA